MNDPRSRLILALDLPDRAHAIQAVDRLAGQVGIFKVGLELFVREGPSLVETILARDQKVFLDLKLHDIPNTVAGAVQSACRLGVQMLTLHAAGGQRMLEAACDAAASAAHPPLLLAVTALTSLSRDDLASIGISNGVDAWVERLAAVALRAGIGGLVASPLEVARLRSQTGPGVTIVTPGIRPAGRDSQDQSRTSEPGHAILAGADYLVVGRPILKAADPAATASSIAGEVGRALSRLQGTPKV